MVMEQSYRDMYWAGFMTVLSIVGLIVMLHIGIRADERQRQINEQYNTTEVI